MNAGTLGVEQPGPSFGQQFLDRRARSSIHFAPAGERRLLGLDRFRDRGDGGALRGNHGVSLNWKRRWLLSRSPENAGPNTRLVERPEMAKVVRNLFSAGGQLRHRDPGTVRTNVSATSRVAINVDEA